MTLCDSPNNHSKFKYVVYKYKYMYKVHLGLFPKKLLSEVFGMDQKGDTFDHDFFVVFGKHCRTENLYVVHQHNIFL